MNYYLSVIIILAVAGVATLSGSHLRLELQEKTRQRLLWAMTLVFFVVYAALGTYKLEAMQMGNWDFGIYDSLLRNAANGRGLMRDYRGMFDHFSPIILIFAPLYRIWDSQLWLVLIQSSALAFAAPLLYATARHYFKRSSFPLLLTAMYLFNPYYSRLALYDFHAECLFPLFFFGAFYFYSQKRMIPFFILLALSPLIKEDFVIPVGAIGLWLLTQRGKRCWGVGAIALAILYVFFVLKVYYPHILKVNYWHYNRYVLFAPTFTETMRNAGVMFAKLFNATTFPVVISVLLPFALLPLFNWKSFLFLWLPVIGIQLVSDNLHQRLLLSHYSSALIAVTPVAALCGARSLRASKLRIWQFCNSRKFLEIAFKFRRAAFAGATVTMLCCHIAYCDLPISRYMDYIEKLPPYQGGIISLPLRPIYWQEMARRLRHANKVKAIFEQLPVTPQSTMICQNEPGVYFLPKARVFDFPEIGFGNVRPDRADFFVMDRGNYCGDGVDLSEVNDLIQTLAKDPTYKVISHPNGVLVFYRPGVPVLQLPDRTLKPADTNKN
ncbi:MAG: DUF2079 domain-containing protein [Victivallales bacterium]|jgi:uncharacterized membrane protein|nr:DUF2079 domain-containing protein [Victivallales bacterium]